MKIKSSHPESQGEFVEIDESAFDPAVHEIYEPVAEGKQAANAPETAPQGAELVDGGQPPAVEEETPQNEVSAQPETPVATNPWAKK